MHVSSLFLPLTLLSSHCMLYNHLCPLNLGQSPTLSPSLLPAYRVINNYGNSEDSLPSVSAVVYSLISGCGRTQGDLHRRDGKQATCCQQRNKSHRLHFQNQEETEAREVGGFNPVTELTQQVHCGLHGDPLPPNA